MRPKAQWAVIGGVALAALVLGVAAPMNGSVARVDEAGTIEISLDFARD